MLRHSDNDQSAAFRVGLRRVNSTLIMSFDNRLWQDPDSLVQLKPIEHAMLNIYPDEVRLRGCEEFCDERARNTVSNTEQCLCWVCLRILQSFLQISRVREHSRTVRCLSMQMRLLAVGLVLGHRGRMWRDVGIARDCRMLKEVLSRIYAFAYYYLIHMLIVWRR